MTAVAREPSPRVETRGPYVVRYPATPEPVTSAAEFLRSRRQSVRIETIMTLSWINLCIAIAMSVAGQTLLKAGALTRPASTDLLAQLLDPRTVAGLTLYVAAAFLYIIALRRIPLSVALPCTAAS
jgi:multidrug transporter EmrE-like cation transporter